ncbi:hypothetical protein FOA52_011469 [Chlamydomonas sp. UWO 241]|nr:hypothetical protein FOA52_011469 [Chlamydomonas sp. UWO 241]
MRASLILHDMFGTDPLGEHVLTTIRHVQATLALPDAAFFPQRFRCVAALASAGRLWRGACAAPGVAAVGADLSAMEMWSTRKGTLRA